MFQRGKGDRRLCPRLSPLCVGPLIPVAGYMTVSMSKKKKGDSVVPECVTNPVVEIQISIFVLGDEVTNIEIFISKSLHVPGNLLLVVFLRGTVSSEWRLRSYFPQTQSWFSYEEIVVNYYYSSRDLGKKTFLRMHMGRSTDGHCNCSLLLNVTCIIKQIIATQGYSP